MSLEIKIAPERLDEGAPEERAAFGLFTMRVGEVLLTEGFDSFINATREGPLVSGYYVAQWLAWNWWRLRWEPRGSGADWAMAHRLNTIGEGYVWPNITIATDGVRTTLFSDQSVPDIKPFRYAGAMPIILPARDFEAAVDGFVAQILARLDQEGVVESNLSRLWSEVEAERRDPERAALRKMEALLGFEPDEAPEEILLRLQAETEKLGKSATEEMAAQGREGLRTAEQLEEIAERQGFVSNTQDAVRLGAAFPFSAATPAWRIGANAARALRASQRLGAAPISNTRLAEMAAVRADLITEPTETPPFIFSLRQGQRDERIVLSGSRPSNRRFALSRLIGDRLFLRNEVLHPATKVDTYRQKAQRSFAAELLSPFEAVDEMMAGDYGTDRQSEVAEHFDVSDMTINSLLKNHGRIERDASDFDGDDVALAA